MQISRENLDPNNGEYKFAKLGRMLREEAEAVIPLMQKALEHMPKSEDSSEEGSDSTE